MRLLGWGVMSPFRLLRQRRFLPYFLTQAGGAFNDNASRQAMLVLVGLQMGLGSAAVAFYSYFAQALFILPFFLFSVIAGQLAERMDPARLMRRIKLFEIAAMLLAALGFWLHSIPLLCVVLFLMGVHAALFGPVKYSILPRVLDAHEELVGGNGLVAATTSLAILLGMLAGGAAMASGAHGVWLVSALLVAVALFGYAAARRIPALPAARPQARLHWNIARESWRALALLREDRSILNAVLGIAWFWFYAGIFTAQLPDYSTGDLGGTASVAILALALFSIGVGIGALGCERLSGHKVEVGLVPLGAIGFTLAGLDLYFARPGAPLHGGLDWRAWLGAPGNLHVALDLLLVGLFAGLYIVPLYAQIQVHAKLGQLSRIIAANNVLNALFIVAAAGFAFLALRLGLGIPELFLAVALMNVAVSAYIFLLAPEYLMRAIAWVLVHTLYRLRTRGLQRVPAEGPLLLVCNHVSYMDPLIILGSVRRPLRFVMDNRIFVTPVLRYVFRVGRAIPIAPAREDAAVLGHAYDEIDAALAAGEAVCIFPEGALSHDGKIVAFKPGVEHILARRPVPVLPLALRGLWGSVFSRRDNFMKRMRLPRRFRSHIALVAGTPLDGATTSAQALEAAVRALRGTWA